MESLEVRGKNMARQEKIKAAVKETAGQDADLNFAAVRHKLQKEKPELLAFESA